MAIPYLKLTPVKKAGTSLGRAAHHSGTKVTHGAAGRHSYLSASLAIGADGLVTDYRKKFGVEHAELVLPGGGTCNAEKFWNSVDAHKTQRETADVAYDFIVAFPHEFSKNERKKAARELADWITERYKIAVGYGMHLPETHKGSSEKNYHGHYLISARKVSEDGALGFVQRELNHRVCRQRDVSRGRTQHQETAVQEIRMAWQRIANKHLVKAGHEPLDMRSYQKQGIKKMGGRHLGAITTRALREERRLIQAAKLAANTRAIPDSEIRKHLVRIAEDNEDQCSKRKAAANEIKNGRWIEIDPKIRFAVGSAAAYDRDAFGQFFRDIKRQNAIAKRRPRKQRRDYTPEEREAVRELGLAAKRSEQVAKSARRLLAVEDLGSLMIAAPNRNDRGWVRSVRQAVSRRNNPRKRRAA